MSDFDNVDSSKDDTSNLISSLAGAAPYFVLSVLLGGFLELLKAFADNKLDVESEHEDDGDFSPS